MHELTSAERRALRARAHHLHPVVMVGEAGLTAQVTEEIDRNLRSHELIKVRVMADDRAARHELISAICDASGAQPVQEIGKILVIYREKPREEQKKTRSKPKRKPQRRTKRSYQNT